MMPKLAEFDEEIDKYFILMEEVMLTLNHIGVLTPHN